MPEPVTIQTGDVVMIRRGPAYFALVQRASATELAVMPLTPQHSSCSPRS